ncbi:MAG: hypothetical protein Q9162_007671 [Coniocarpon cinnabarinum]
MPLTFKGDKPKNKKRKRHDDAAPLDVSNKFDTSSTIAESPAVKPSHKAIDIPAEEDDSWTSPDNPSDLAGPTILVLSTAPHAALATDAAGSIFPSRLENIIDDNPSTAEPHDVRQVWIANRVAGTDTLSFKGHHGKYLSCSREGSVSALKEAVGPEEQWTVGVAESGEGYTAKNVHGTYLGVEENDENDGRAVERLKVRGDFEELGRRCEARLRMQARFKPRIKVQKEEKAREKISRRQLEEAVGRTLEDEEVRILKKARKQGDYHEVLLDIKVKGKSDKFA